MIYLILLALCFNSFATTVCPESMVLTKQEQKIEICISGEVSISRSCYEDAKCNWRKEIEELKKVRPTISDLSGGKNPLSAKCTLSDHTVHILRDSEGHEQSFCEFAPGKYVSTANLE